MKRFITLIVSALVLQVATAQIDLFKKLEKKTNQRIDKKIDKAIDDGLDETENSIDDSKNDSDKKQSDGKGTNKSSEGNQTKSTKTQNEETNLLATYGKYDFIQGDTIIFEDDFVEETIGEFPSKWKLASGSAENIKSGEFNCLAFIQTSSEVVPLMKTENFLPKIFTIEFDLYFYLEGNEAYSLRFGSSGDMTIRNNSVSFDKFKGTSTTKKGKGWQHVAIAVNDRKMKVYLDESRVLNIPEIPKSLQKVEFRALSHGASMGKPSIIKSVRIAEGGMDLYKRIMSDGKYIARGILFDVNKSTLKPQSMGQINEMVKLMKDHPEMKFSIEGHTDSDGDENTNQKLSEERALTVKNQMISMGIDSANLESKGLGESKPCDDNTSPEGKANNRRVEFIKK